MTSMRALSIIRWFAACGGRYEAAYLGHVDAKRLAVDKRYGLQKFLFSWAFERAGAPRGYRIAAVKAVASLGRSQEGLPALFKRFYAGKPNRKANPVLDSRITSIDVPRIVQMVGDGALPEAFDALELRGVGSKIRAFFLRDLVTVLRAERKLESRPENYLWCQPIDVWVRLAAERLCPTPARLPLGSGRYPLKGADLDLACGIIGLSKDAGVSPLRVNQGIWYFNSNAVADGSRLRDLISSGNDKELQAELDLMKGFLPTHSRWG